MLHYLHAHFYALWNGGIVLLAIAVVALHLVLGRKAP
jgi:hypothetical protein